MLVETDPAELLVREELGFVVAAQLSHTVAPVLQQCLCRDTNYGIPAISFARISLTLRLVGVWLKVN